jgi:hypothetical protein
MNTLPVYKESFFFSQKREDGLKLQAVYTGGHVYTDFKIDEKFQNQEDRPYNGIIFGIMDTLMWYALIMQTRRICMTRKTIIEFIAPMPCNITYRAKGRLLDVDEKDFRADGWIEDKDGRLYARASALFKESRTANIQDIIKSFDFSETTAEMREFFGTLYTGIGSMIHEKY